MIDPSFDTAPVTMTEYVTVEGLERHIEELNKKIDSLEHDKQYLSDRYNTLRGQVDNLQEYVKDNFDYIDESVSQELVDIFGLEITRDYDVTVTVEFSGTVSVPLNYDIDGLEDSLHASLEFSSYEDGEADFMEDRMTIDWTEA